MKSLSIPVLEPLAFSVLESLAVTCRHFYKTSLTWKFLALTLKLSLMPFDSLLLFIAYNGLNFWCLCEPAWGAFLYGLTFRLGIKIGGDDKKQKYSQNFHFLHCVCMHGTIFKHLSCCFVKNCCKEKVVSPSLNGWKKLLHNNNEVFFAFYYVSLAALF